MTNGQASALVDALRRCIDGWDRDSAGAGNRLTQEERWDIMAEGERALAAAGALPGDLRVLPGSVPPAGPDGSEPAVRLPRALKCLVLALALALGAFGAQAQSYPDVDESGPGGMPPFMSSPYATPYPANVPDWQNPEPMQAPNYSVVSPPPLPSVPGAGIDEEDGQ